MPLSWNEIKDRAIRFSNEWKNTHQEEADAKPFLVELFNVFGISHKRVSTFEHRVKKLSEADGYIDLLWKGNILVEMKSRGKNLDKAYEQAKEYLHGLKDHELPKCILVSDFAHFRLYDLLEGTVHHFTLDKLVQNVQHFGFLIGYQKKQYKPENPANVKAAELMGKLHDRLEAIGYHGHPLEVYLVRILFCLFAEDTTIFQKQQFQDYLEQRTSPDGADLAPRLQELFQVLNTPAQNRFRNLDEQLADFPYVNGRLFEENLPTASFDAAMRQALLNCCYLDWSQISPAIFGSMFQSVMDPMERRNLGAHYTSETNILKVIKPLFLDGLWEEFGKLKAQPKKLREFHQKLAKLRILDPACGCGNFLVITYRELRLLEMELLRATHTSKQGVIDVSTLILLDVDQFYGIEYEEFPAQIAQVAMWLLDHQMNMLISQEFGQYFVRLPLRKAANIVQGNALRMDWQALLNPENQLTIYADHANMIMAEPVVRYGTVNVVAKQWTALDALPPRAAGNVWFDYIIGNPPFVGHHYQNEAQKADMALIAKSIVGNGVLDYVGAWFVKAADYMKRSLNSGYGAAETACAFVATNSITQGEQAGLLWKHLLEEYGIKIHFAHQTFSWTNEARGKAAVHVVIVGFANRDLPQKRLFSYQSLKAEPTEQRVANINPYLIAAPDLLVTNRSQPICPVPKMIWGNKPTDGGQFLFEDEAAMKAFLALEPGAEKWIRPFVSGSDFINGHQRYCLWLVGIPPHELRALKQVVARVEAVKRFRLASRAAATNKKAATPTLFAQIAQPTTPYLAIPEVSSERRQYVPIAFLPPEVIASNTIQLVPDATPYHFGCLTSTMHMIWMKVVAGRLESRFRYSNSIVYNNFPWPDSPTPKAVKAVETAAEKVLAVRSSFPESSLADLYDPVTMPPALAKAHAALDKAVEQAYRTQPFTDDAQRMAYLFGLWEKFVLID